MKPSSNHPHGSPGFTPRSPELRRDISLPVSPEVQLHHMGFRDSIHPECHVGHTSVSLSIGELPIRIQQGHGSTAKGTVPVPKEALGLQDSDAWTWPVRECSEGDKGSSSQWFLTLGPDFRPHRTAGAGCRCQPPILGPHSALALSLSSIQRSASATLLLLPT
jgi:hypothetical protein